MATLTPAMQNVLNTLVAEKVGYLGLSRYPANTVYALEKRGLVRIEEVYVRCGGYEYRIHPVT